MILGPAHAFGPITLRTDSLGPCKCLWSVFDATEGKSFTHPGHGTRQRVRVTLGMTSLFGYA